MSDIPSLFTEFGPYFILGYIIVKDLIPKLFPQYLSTISKRTTVEDRLFKLLEDSSKSQADLAVALNGLQHMLETIDTRISRVEELIVDTLKYRLIIDPSKGQVTIDQPKRPENLEQPH